MLFWKECKKTIFSLTFVLYVATVAAMYISQFGEALEEPLAPPREGQRDYGTTVKEVPEILMPAASERLVAEYVSGHYTAYPMLFYKEVKLSADKREKMAAIIEELTGISARELDGFSGYEEAGFYVQVDENGEERWEYREAVLPEIHMPADLTYERFRELMEEADKLIGGGSSYGEQYLLHNFGRVPMSYEEALAEYEEVVADSNLAQAYTRLFCDYLGIVLSVMPVFVCASLWMLDRRSHMEQLIYGRSRSSVQIVGMRQLALFVCMSVPVLLTWLHAAVSVAGMYPEKSLAWGRALGLMLLWLLPSILMVSALGALTSELFSPLFVVFIQAAWWIASLSTNRLTGSITKWTLVIRHNSLYATALFRSQFGDFVVNRCGCVVLALLGIALTMFLYDKKRKGVFSFGRKNLGGGSVKNLQKNRRSQSAA